MSPVAKHNTKWIIAATAGILSILIAVVSATTKVNAKFAENASDHSSIVEETIRNGEGIVRVNARVSTEVIRSTAQDNESLQAIQGMQIEQAVMNSILIQQQTMLEEIKSAVNRSDG